MHETSDRPTVLVTGAAGGIGAAVARVACDRGWRVIGVDRDEGGLGRVETAIPSGFRPEVLDLRDLGEVERFWARLQDERVALRGLVNNAGVLDFDRIEDLEVHRWQEQIHLNLTIPFVMTRSAAPLLQNGASIVNVSSLAGISGLAGAPAYASAKAGLIGLTKTSAREFADRQIRCNAVVPGPVATSMLAGLSRTVRDERVAAVLLGRAADPVEVAETIAFLLSDAASFVTGQQLVVDGGRADKL